MSLPDSTFPHLNAENVKKVKTLKVAELLGWTRGRGTKNKSGYSEITNTAKAAVGALKLINEGYHKREDFAGLGTTAVMQLVQKGNALINQAKAIAEKEKLSEQQLEKQSEQG